MTALEKEIEEVKKKHLELEKQQYRDALQAKYEKYKALEGTIECRVAKTGKIHRHVSLTHHISYTMLKDSWKHETDKENMYIGVKTKSINISESFKGLYPEITIKRSERNPKQYNGKMGAKDDTSGGYDFATKPTDITVDQFYAIWDLVKLTGQNILDGILDIKDIRWLMNGTTEERIYKPEEVNSKLLDIPHIVVSTEESWKLDNQFCSLYLNKNIFMITPGSLKALDDWLSYEQKSDNWSASACASVGERWRGSRMSEYYELVSKIKSHKV
jgi:hypothetical protein